MTLTPPPLDQGDTVVVLAGDWHGNLMWAEKALREVGARGIRTVYHLGDFGVWPGASGKKFLYRVNKLCAELGITIWVTPGNHEDWDRIDALHARDGGTGPQSLEEHIWLLPRGFRWTHAGRSFVSLGGAPSIDFEYRTTGRDWWLTEVITPEVTARVAAAGPADIMLAHDTPNTTTDAVGRILAGNPMGWSAYARAYAGYGRERLDEAVAGVKPQLYAHGHYHVQGERTGPDGARILSVHQDGYAGNLVSLDLTADDFGVHWMEFARGTAAATRPLRTEAEIDAAYRAPGASFGDRE